MNTDDDQPKGHEHTQLESDDEKRREKEQNVATEPLSDGDGKVADVPMGSEAGDSDTGSERTPFG